MGRVHVLADDVVSLISAGEVIESPASVVKELIENSLDAGASLIDIEISGGGIDTIRVSDNGKGIFKDDVPICIQRYSTSKIRTKDDIERIETYGFRGEALASIAAVAEVRILTKHNAEEIGSSLVKRPNENPIITDYSRPDGTTIEVRDLFSQVPARRKHLSDTKVESQRVHETVMKHAVIREDVGFRLIRDGETVIDCPPGQNARDRILTLWGTDYSRNLAEIDYKVNDILISGFIVKPPITRGNRGREYFSILRRPIEEPRLSKAVEAAYSTLLMRGRFPICSINISMESTKVDANIHPNKKVVKVLDLDNVVSHVMTAVRVVLHGKKKDEQVDSLEDFIEIVQDESTVDTEQERSEKPLPAIQQPLFEHLTLLAEEDLEQQDDSIQLEGLGGEFRILGIFQNLYILLEVEDALVLVDQHAAHERVLYEKLRQQINNGTVLVQELLEPILVRLNPHDIEKILSLRDTLEKIGYEIAEFGGSEILISTLPTILHKVASEREMLSLIDRILDVGTSVAVQEFMDEVVRITACHSAVRAGQALSNSEIRQLLIDLSQTDTMFACCHGRPSIIRLTRDTIDKRFGRKNPDAITRYKARHGME